MKKKEILLLVVILSITLFLVFLPQLKSLVSKAPVVSTTEERKNTIEVRITGEINQEEVILKVPYGASHVYILSKLDAYLNSYSILDTSTNKRYYEDTTIFIASLDTGHDLEKEVITSDKIQISTASYDVLLSLYGIGEKRAKSIIEYRETHEITSWEVLKSLLGVSNEVIEAIQEKAIL